MHIGSTLLLIWLVIGAVVAGQRGDYTGPTNCSRVGTVTATVIAGPINYMGLNPRVSCTVTTANR